jgi:hypothetical protein
MTTKYTKWPQNIPNDHEIYQMATKYTKWPRNIPNGHKNIPNGHKIYQMTTKYTKWPRNIPNGHKIYQMTTKYTKWPQKYTNILHLPRQPKIYPNWDFWNTNIPTGNPEPCYLFELPNSSFVVLRNPLAMSLGNSVMYFFRLNFGDEHETTKAGSGPGPSPTWGLMLLLHNPKARAVWARF